MKVRVIFHIPTDWTATEVEGRLAAIAYQVGAEGIGDGIVYPISINSVLAGSVSFRAMEYSDIFGIAPKIPSPNHQQLLDAGYDVRYAYKGNKWFAVKKDGVRGAILKHNKRWIWFGKEVSESKQGSTPLVDKKVRLTDSLKDKLKKSPGLVRVYAGVMECLK